MKKTATVFLSLIVLGVCSSGASASDTVPNSGILLYHNYSSYENLDSRLYQYNFKDNAFTEIKKEGFSHAMNADFGSHPYDITFMAIDTQYDEWDIYRYNSYNGEIINLTPNSGFRNEDPKFSPDGNKIVFKRGHWSSEKNDFIYNLAEIELKSGKITMLTDDDYEESMPYYSADGSDIFYARSFEGESDIYVLDLRTGLSSPVYAEKGVFSYYPMVSDDKLYFTKWFSADNRNDCIVRVDDNEISVMPFNDSNCNTSDVYPLSNGSMFFSSTRNGSYDIFFYDGNTEYDIGFINTDLQELGASYFSAEDAECVLTETSDFLLNRSDSDKNMDADGDGTVSVFDLVALRKQF